MSKPLRAWLLDWEPQLLALAQCEMVEVVDDPEIHRVPIGPAWCRALLYWRERILPLALAEDTTLSGHSVVVVAYQLAAGTPLEYAALAVRGVPKQFDVPEAADCDPPQPCVFELQQLRACFSLEGRAIVVPELSSLFAQAAAA